MVAAACRTKHAQPSLRSLPAAGVAHPSLHLQRAILHAVRYCASTYPAFYYLFIPTFVLLFMRIT